MKRSLLALELIAFSSVAYSATSYQCRLENNASYGVVFTVEGNTVLQYGNSEEVISNPEPDSVIDGVTAEYSMWIDTHMDEWIIFVTTVQNEKVSSVAVWRKGNDSDNYQAVLSDEKVVCENL